ncbi:CobW family GTP-binding protein [Aliivibrio fischeri]|uniref:CobW family GTP-binding protein n=1 Tax=Aliivibrio fischeri TaxID=668 RepID=UPI0012D8AD2D|nr:GTP-binding protein [Aliivibrio fischeri]MUH97401.1 GTP-binding protein [Aliivibrio fischeri]MUI65014.1 GTP-binding protein [Aliivibrio fischeri]USR97255.1 GTP-binding protein [Aliivibrio fischeri ATCC 7744 = JCM 18803 = DSM 507]GGK38248.1 GTPase [Aliivibrio fischeri]
MKKIPTNIITGFLGVGKTTTILQLLKNKPENESWAVLVNEFGEIGIDGAFLAEGGAMVKEVPGGCMCCTAGLPMSVGINALLRQKPDHLIIEPTGLGHPKKIIAILQSENYEKYIDLKATIGLVDPRNLSDDKYVSNQNFNDQLGISDVVVATKMDMVSDYDECLFDSWAKELSTQPKTTKINYGELPQSWLDEERTIELTIEEHHHHHAEQDIVEMALEPGQKFCRKENKGQGYVSCGWFFGAESVFDFEELFSMLSDLNAERIKAVMNTDKGCYAFNVANRVVSVNQLSIEGMESKLEVIDTQLLPWDQLETILLSLIIE